MQSIFSRNHCPSRVKRIFFVCTYMLLLPAPHSFVQCRQNVWASTCFPQDVSDLFHSSASVHIFRVILLYFVIRLHVFLERNQWCIIFSWLFNINFYSVLFFVHVFEPTFYNLRLDVCIKIFLIFGKYDSSKLSCFIPTVLKISF